MPRTTLMRVATPTSTIVQTMVSFMTSVTGSGK
jgi:hypothetical protein